MTSEKRRSQLGVIFLTVFLDLVGFSIIFPLFPDMLEYYFKQEGADGLFGQMINQLRDLAGGDTVEMRDLRTTVLFGGILGSLYSVLQFIFAPIWGSYSDRVGRKKVLTITILGLAISYLAWSLAASFAVLVFARLFGGIMSGNIAVASAAIADETDEKGRTKGMALVGMAFGLGFICGPAIGSLLSKIDLSPSDGAASMFGLNPFSTPAFVALGLSVLNLFWVKSKFQETLPEEQRGKATTRRPVNPLKLFRSYEFPGVNRTNLAYFFFIVLFAGMEFTLTFLAKDRFNYAADEMYKIFLFIGFLIALTQGGLVRRLAPKLGEKKLTLGGLVLLPAGLALAGLAQESQVLFYTGLGLLAVGSACVTPSMNGLVSLYSPADRQGEMQGVFRSLGALGRAVGPISACFLYWHYGAKHLYLIGAAFFILPILIAATLPPARRESKD